MTTTLLQRNFFRFERMAARMFGRIQDKTFAMLVPHKDGTTLAVQQENGILSLRVDFNITESMILPWPLVKEAAVNRDGFVELDRDDTQVIMKHEVGASVPLDRSMLRTPMARESLPRLVVDTLWFTGGYQRVARAGLRQRSGSSNRGPAAYRWCCSHQADYLPPRNFGNPTPCRSVAGTNG